MEKKKVVIIGAGPAGLTAAYELLNKSDIIPIVIEKLNIPGGLSRTINYKGNKIDIGGHRFFSKSDKVLEWWLKILPFEKDVAGQVNINYQNKLKSFSAPVVGNTSPDEVMLLRNRNSRIYFLKQLFPYPVTMNISTLKKLGVIRSLKILFSYFVSKVFPIKSENTLKDFLINRFGKELYKTFFEDYTRKVWGVEPEKIPAEWGRQRIKGVSVSTIIANAIKKKKSDDLRQKNVETSLIEKFLYPKYGPGQLWEKVANKIVQAGGTIIFDHEVKELNTNNGAIEKVLIKHTLTSEQKIIEGDFFISTMPIKDLVNALDEPLSKNIIEIANGLEYREFITIGLLVKQLELKEKDGNLIKDNWIYIQEKGVKLGRLQIFNNWSPFMVNDPETVWLGLEYFCQRDDYLWSMSEQDLLQLAKNELMQIGIINKNAVIDGTVIKVEKAYPGYFGTYDKINEVRDRLDQYENLFLIGRNGMHRYNNQDHSMLTAIEAVNKIINDDRDKSSIWAINTEDIYHEES